MEIKNIKIDDLELNKGQMYGLPKNPRFIRDERFAALKKSIEDAPEMLSLRELIVYPLPDKDGKFIVIGGNMRLRACRDIGYKELPCKIITKETPVEKLREYAIKDNNGFGQDDWSILKTEWDLDELNDWGVEIPSDFGEMSSDGEQEEVTAEEDDFSEETDEIETRCQIGDIWQLGENRLMCGDSTKAEDVAELMDGAKADLIFTDPPYGIKTKGGRQQTFSKHGMTEIENDNIIGEDLVLFLKSVFIAMPLKDDASVYVCYPWKTQAEFTEAIIQSGLILKACIVWDKKVFGLNGSQHGYRPQHELIYFACKGNYKWYGDKSQSDIWQISREINRDEQGNHPTPKPIALCAKAITNSSRDGEIVLDVFGGSGSTLIACEQLKRKCYMMELDPHYCDVIIARWEKLTGKTATKI